MKEFFYFWITIQLIVIGYASVCISNEIKQEVYKCPTKETVTTWVGVLFPLIAFVPETNQEIKYCENYIKKDKY